MEFKIKKSHQENFGYAIWHFAFGIEISKKNKMTEHCIVRYYLKELSKGSFVGQRRDFVKLFHDNNIRETLTIIHKSFNKQLEKQPNTLWLFCYIQQLDEILNWQSLNKFAQTHTFEQAVNIIEEFINERYLEWKKS